MGANLAKRMSGYRPNPLPGIDVSKQYEIASFGGGCFWGVEKMFRYTYPTSLRATSVGYMGGHEENPTYEKVCSGDTGHAETVQIQYYPDKVEYADLVRFFYRIHDPTTKDRQGNDVGTQYRSVIFCHSPEQFAVAREVTREMTEKWGEMITTELSLAPPEDFKVAEDYHQMYLEKNPDGYCNHKLRFCVGGESEYPKKPY